MQTYSPIAGRMGNPEIMCELARKRAIRSLTDPSVKLTHRERAMRDAMTKNIAGCCQG